jgi:hypothetical protein
VLLVVPSAALAVAACVEAWAKHGSINAADWLADAVLAALLAATVLLSGAARRPGRAAAAGVGLLFGLAAWDAISAAWSPVPSLARDEALLAALFAVSLSVPLLSLSLPQARMLALWALALVFGGFAALAAVELRFGAGPLTRFFEGRLYFPITYSNAQAALFLAGFWPGVVLASRRAAHPAARAVALGAAAAGVAAALVAQSKGSVLGFAAAVVVVTAVSPARLRILLATALAVVPAAATAWQLTGPFRHPESAGAARTAGGAVLVAALIGLALGAAYALADRRVDLTRVRRRVATGVGAAAGAAAVVAAIVFITAVGSPAHWVSQRWSSFKTYPANGESATTHLADLGSNRYDFWRASLRLFERHPIAGCGARCFGPEYLLDRRSPERPRRAHSLLFDTAAEDGIVGLALLGGAFGCLLAAIGRAARRRRGPAIAALGGGTMFLAQAAVDWTWTFPAVGIAYAVLIGTGAATDDGDVLRPRAARAGGALAVALAVLAFAPPWLSARLTTSATDGSASDPQAALRWARRLDPLSTAPILAQALSARTATDELRYLREVTRKEPRVMEPHYFLGVALLNLGQKSAARTQLERALRLDPGNRAVEDALAKAQ